MRAVTRLDTNQAGFDLRKKLQHLSAAELSLHHGFALAINAVNLKHIFCDIQTDG
ncbi:hypothetical protein LMG29542_08708 [Paraburkholderia humisilvae]|uniref:Uncharacterized protein n=1 Tax=Paraburkholderia humisilvae TaxID=627669 RepID=A0A6J5FDH1_9BURK|nr:hypothetical protein LMG29542_08708 [Paraburkholderia humisilvae]